MRDYSLLGNDGKLAVERGLSQVEWYRSPVARKRMKELMRRRNGPAIRDTLLAEYEVAAENLERDLDRLLNELISQGLLSAG